MDLEIRCKDLAKLLRGFRAKLKQVQSQNGNMAKIMLERIVEGVERNFSVMAEAVSQSERSSASSYDVLLVLFTAFLAFELIDRITDGKLLGIDGHFLGGMQWARDTIAKDLLAVPLAWFSLDFAWVVAIVTVLNALIAVVIWYMTKTQVVRFVVNERINVAALESLLKGKTIESRMANFTADTKIVTVVWFEKNVSRPLLQWKWRQWPTLHLGPSQRTQIVYDLVNHFLLNVSFHVGPHSCLSVYL
jgi:hypothetical protein